MTYSIEWSNEEGIESEYGLHEKTSCLSCTMSNYDIGTLLYKLAILWDIEIAFKYGSKAIFQGYVAVFFQFQFKKINYIVNALTVTCWFGVRQDRLYIFSL